MRKGLLRAFLILAALLASGCFDTDNKMAGGGGVEVEGITVEGMAYFSDNKPAVGARVKVRPWDYIQAAAVPKTAKDRADTVTDSLGRFSVDSLDPGVYSILVDAGESGQALMKAEADGSRKVVQVEGTLWAVGRVAGTVRTAAGQALEGVTVGLYGMDKIARTDSAGYFLMDSLAPGVYTFKIQAPGDSLSSIDVPEVAVGAGSKVFLDSLVLPVKASANLRAHWRFDEGLGKVAAEAGGSEARAILYGALWTPGRHGQALDLRDRGHAAVPRTKAASLGIAEGQDFMVALWFKADPSAGAGTVRTLADTRTSYETLGWAVALGDDGRATFLASRSKDGGDDAMLSGGTRLDDGNWHHLAAGRSGNRYLLYVDGVPASEGGAPAGLLTAQSPLYVGAKEGKSDFFTGLVDDLRLYDKALTAAEAEALARP